MVAPEPERFFDEIMGALNAHSIVVITDLDGRITYANDRFCQISQYSSDELIGQTHRIVNSGFHPPEFFAELWKTITRGEVWQNEICNRAKDGSEYWVNTTIVPLLDADGAPTSYVSLRTEETQRHLAEQEVRRLAYVDPVTGLDNRAAMLQAIEDHGALNADGQTFAAFLTVSVDQLSTVNDAFGFEAGDRLLLDAAQRLCRLESGAVRIGRIGSNTYGLLLTDLGADLDVAQRRTVTMIESVLDLLVDTVELGSDITVGSGASVGYVIWASERGDIGAWLDASTFIVSNDPNEIVKCSEIARKRARRLSGQRRVQPFEQRMMTAVQERMMLVSELRTGIRQGELRLFAQPIVDRERRVIGHEGLIRWQNGCRGLVPPDDFIPLAEQTGLIVEIGEFVLEEACRILSTWALRPETRDLTFSVNLSERQLRVPDFAEHIRDVITRHGIPADRLKLELTESVLHSDLDRTVRLLKSLRAEGVMSSLDDFGTGYSSLSYLRQLPVQQLKIDRSFVSSVVEDPQAAAITETIVQLGRIFDLQVVGEGVETEEQFEMLRGLGVDAFQGYLFGRPVPLGAELEGTAPRD
ncbi:putative bifunctional diguanylate cyclase/phosphodiesterase [Leucobacter japonicus]|uniref:putative bifunctional diguanylate cyclase/phosphodiesterase n=1 Tax=Leucobacter japonicus TaxID=1461259 RepID=UPI0006A78FC3|nr:GGDEF domain-containing phosphodiesterase [Leucobacter japonicus]